MFLKKRVAYFFLIAISIMSDTHSQPATKESSTRQNWRVGSAVEIFSKSADQWCMGSITRIFEDDEGEWLHVDYVINHTSKRCKQVPRNNRSTIRPLQPSSSSATNAPNDARTWVQGSNLEVYSRRNEKWMLGTVIGVSGRKGVCLEIEYDDGHLRKTTNRFSINVRAHHSRTTVYCPINVERWNTRWRVRRGALICAFWMRTTLKLDSFIPLEVMDLIMKFWYIPQLPFSSAAWNARNTPTPSRVQRILDRSLEIGGIRDNLTIYEIAVYSEVMTWRSSGDRGSVYDQVLDDHSHKEVLKPTLSIQPW